ncbi:MAG TPA: glycosyltransferase [Firmicutes bacterium]|jgi:glycosyltransferase involved in cell wall biosynthesis|nr:glycosyltransferase [Bacillota bacterium]
MGEKQVSCIIPCYNSQEYIHRTVDSIMDQTIRPSELILINGCSTDNTLDILREIENQNNDIVKVIDLEENKGVSYARNFGAKNSNGDYILFLDSDDIVKPWLIERYQLKLRELNNGSEDKYILCYSAYIQIDENDNQVSEIVNGIQVEPDEILGYEFYRNYIISTSGVMVKKDFFNKSCGFNKKLNYSEDWDLWLRLAALGGFAYVDEPLTQIRRHETNVSSSVDRMLDGEKAVLKQYDIEYIRKALFKRKLDIEVNTVDYVSILFRFGFWENGLIELKALLKKGSKFYNLYFHLGLYYLKSNELEQALGYFEESIMYKNDHGAALNNAGALHLLKGNRKTAEKYLGLAIQYFPLYLDAKYNYDILGKKDVLLGKIKFTWRELRNVLTIYNG